MKNIFSGIFLCLWGMISVAQDIGGKWYGKISQGPGGYSTLYDFDLDLNAKKNIQGESDAYIKNVLKIRILLRGNMRKDSVILHERFAGIQEEYVPPDWVACIKNLRLKYFYENGIEFLRGSWDGISKEDFSPCIPGNIVLTRSKEVLEQIVANGHIDNSAPIFTTITAPDLGPTFNNTEVKKTTEIEVRNKIVQLRLNDYMRVDNDTVSVFFNRTPIISKARISKKIIKYDLRLNESIILNEILIFAENLGTIPPNTSQLLVIDGDRIHKVMIESDMQKTAAVYLKYTP